MTARSAHVRSSMTAGVLFALAGQALGQSTELFPAVFELSTLLPANGGDGSNGFVLNGIDENDQGGQSVSSAGDVNGDGIDDFIIGVLGGDPNGNASAGESYVVFGGAGVGGSGVFELAGLDGTNGFVLNGIDAGDNSGISVSSAGDVNGDGIGDIIIGAQTGDPNGNTDAGESYVIFGGVGVGGSGVIELSGLDGSNGFVLNGIDVSDRSGLAVSSAGDVNGDGIGDIIIGARSADPNGNSSAGESYVVFGGVGVGGSGVIELAGLDGSDGFVLNGIDASDLSGSAVSSAGDVNGDGIDDLIIAAYRGDPNGTDRAGEIYVVFGGVGVGGSGVFELSGLDGSNGFVLNGIDEDDFVGTSVSSAGDVNDDGIDDLIIGADGADPNGNSGAGESYVVFGGAGVGGSGVFELSGLDGTNGFVLNGIDSGDDSGRSVSSAGDVNGDGFGDIIIGAREADPNGNLRAGESYVVFGGVGVGGSGVVELSGLDGTDGFVLNGIDAFDNSGRSVSSAGDVNGDGIDDLIIGARYGDPNGISNVGESYVVFGRRTQVWTRSGGGAFETSTNWLAGVVPTAGPITIQPRFGGTVAVTAEADRFFDVLSLGAETGVTTLDIGPASLLGVATPLSLPASAAIGGSGVLIAEAGVSNSGVISGSGVLFAEAGLSNSGLLSGPDLLITSASGVVNTGDISVDGRDSAGSARVSVFGSLTNDASGEILLRESADLAADTIENAGNINVAFADATLAGGLNNAVPEFFITGFVLNGIDAGDQSGRSVSSAGDVNGDGIDDLIIGARYADPNGNSRAGESYVVFGGAGVGGSGVIELAGLDGTNGFVLNGIDAGDASGTSVSSAGDVNGDGIDDLLIGASGGDPNGNSGAGESYVVFGGVGVGGSGVVELSGLNGSNGFVLNGIDSADDSGYSVSAAGDVNGDGVDDLLIGASRANPNGNSVAGESYVVFGGVGVGGSGVVELSGLDGTNGFVLNGIDADDFSGISVSSAGDVNGDGIDDIIIGAYTADPNGTSYAGESCVVFGNAGVGGSGVFELSGLDGSNGFVLDGIDADDYSGASVSSAGDVNGDGVDDLIIGARYADPNGNSRAGESYVVFGGAGVGGSGVIELSGLDGTNGFVLNGIDADDFSGISVSSAGDVNGDGIDDLIIGARNAGLGSAGESYVVFGGVGVGGSGGVELAGLDGSNGFVLGGIDAGDNSGMSVSSAGDLNGDGVDDLIIGAFDADPNGIDGAGESYVVFGREPGSDPFPAVIELGRLAQTFAIPTPGRITVASGSNLLFSDDVANPGTIVLSSDSAISILGSLSGNGVEGPSGPGSAGPVFAFDGIFPGPAPSAAGRGVSAAFTGVMRFDGDLTLAGSTELALDLAGTSPGSGHDQIIVAGTLFAGGSVTLTAVNGFVPQEGDVYRVLDFGAVAGQFGSVFLGPVLTQAGADASMLLVDGTVSIPTASCNAADIAPPSNLLDLGDVDAFIAGFTSGDPVADITAPFGVLDLGDLDAFIVAFLAGCP